MGVLWTFQNLLASPTNFVKLFMSFTNSAKFFLTSANFVKLFAASTNFIKLTCKSQKLCKVVGEFYKLCKVVCKFYELCEVLSNFYYLRKVVAASTNFVKGGFTQGNFHIRFDRLTFFENLHITTTLLSGCYLHSFCITTTCLQRPCFSGCYIQVWL